MILNLRATGKRINLRWTSVNILHSLLYKPVVIQVNKFHLRRSNLPHSLGIIKLLMPANSKYLGYQPASSQSTSTKFLVVLSSIIFRGARSWCVKTRLSSGWVGPAQLRRCSSGLFPASRRKETRLCQKLMMVEIVDGSARAGTPNLSSSHIERQRPVPKEPAVRLVAARIRRNIPRSWNARRNVENQPISVQTSMRVRP